LYVYASVVLSSQARFALIADDVWLDGHAVADLVGFDGWVFGNDDSGGFVAEDVVAFDDHWAYASCVPEVDIGSGMSVRFGSFDAGRYI
jgi:hypothetical protein